MGPGPKFEIGDYLFLSRTSCRRFFQNLPRIVHRPYEHAGPLQHVGPQWCRVEWRRSTGRRLSASFGQRCERGACSFRSRIEASLPESGRYNSGSQSLQAESGDLNTPEPGITASVSDFAAKEIIQRQPVLRRAFYEHKYQFCDLIKYKNQKLLTKMRIKSQYKCFAYRKNPTNFHKQQRKVI